MKTKLLLSFLAFWYLTGLSAQNELFDRYGINDQNAIPVLHLTQPNYEQWRKEDEQKQGNRFAASLPVNIDPATQGEWIENGQTQTWRLKIHVPGATQLALFYENMQLPKGSRLLTFSDDKKIIGPYALSDIPESGRFWTGFSAGENVTIIYQSPLGTSRSPFQLWRLDVGYGNQAGGGMFEFGASRPCHDNINCPTGDNWQTEKHAAARIIVVVAEGSGYCSGTIMNNTAQDKRLLFLSAFHCMDGYTPLYDMWRFDFEYESATCSNPTLEPTFKSILGCTYLAGRRDNDMLLLDLIPPVNLQNYDLHFAGWDRSGVPPLSGGVIHHPLGDIQKVSISNTASTVYSNSINWNNGVVITPPNHHYRVNYSDGTIEVGSSGSSFFDQNHRVVGTLQGDANITACDNTVGYFARLSESWEGGGTPDTRLSDWLDPLNSDTLILNGLADSGQILTDEGEPISGVSVSFAVNGVDFGTTITGLDGKIILPLNLPITDTLDISFSKDNDFINGVSIVDLIRIQKHILTTDTLSTGYRVLGADVNDSGTVSILDMIRIRKLILTVEEDFGNNGIPSWQFYHSNIPFLDITQAWADVEEGPNVFSFELGAGFNLPDFIGVKSADMNGNASN